MHIYGENVNQIVLTKEKLGGKLFEVMGNLLDILTNSGYICAVYADEPGLGIYVIQYDYDSELATNELVWVNPEKYYIGEYGVDDIEGED